VSGMNPGHELRRQTYLLWDESHFWAILLWRCLAAWGVPPRLVRAQDIAQGLLQATWPGVLFVPGGWARFKAEALGEKGRQAIVEYVRTGGTYLGVCGGAGLALTDVSGLGLCPLGRKPMAARLPNFSGYVQAAVMTDHPLVVPGCTPTMPLPVWWPSQFIAPSQKGIDVLAAYVQPGPDFWVSDLELEHISEERLRGWERVYGINLDPGLLRDDPCVIRGTLGSGHYILSYAHLETPCSPAANAWLAHILSLLGEQPLTSVSQCVAPAWDVVRMPVRWDDPGLARMHEHLEALVQFGLRQFLLCWRTPWLLGWRRGVPGFVLTTLYAQIQTIRACLPGAAALAFLEQCAANLEQEIIRFRQEMEQYLLDERLTLYTAAGSPEGGAGGQSHAQREALIGHFPGYGGMFGQIVRQLDELLWLLLASSPENERAFLVHA